ncbi:hypothetical protein ACFDR8_003751 [Arthrobacter sp. MP_2.3]
MLMMWPRKVSRSTMAVQRRGSVKVLVQLEKDSLEAIAMEFFLLAFGEDLEEEFGAAFVQFHVAKFQVIADGYEKRSLIIATNLEFSRWGTVFGDDNMAAAVIDRIVHHGRLLQFRGESYRVKHALMK